MGLGEESHGLLMISQWLVGSLSCLGQNEQVIVLRCSQLECMGRRKAGVVLQWKVLKWMGGWRRLCSSPAAPNEFHKLELSGAWEPPCSSGSSQFSEDSRAQNFVSHGDKIRRLKDGVCSY